MTKTELKIQEVTGLIRRSQVIKARKQFDSEGLGYAEFVASEVK